MAARLNIADNLALPLEAITNTFAIMAMRGVGKTSLASVMAEEMLSAGQPIVAYDPTGAWYGLRSSADGRARGFPVVIFGGEHADVPLEESAGETIARVIVERRVPAVLDVSLLRKAARVRFMTGFCETLYHLNRQPLHLFLDEAHTVCPQNIRALPEATQLLGAVEDIMLQGRRRGLGITVISQRPALVNTNVRTQCGTLIAMRLLGPHDLKAIREWTDAHGTPREADEMLKSLATLKAGEGWVWSPAFLEIFCRVQFRRRQTFDSSATPAIGKAVVTPKVVAEIDLTALGEEIKATVDEAKANDPRELKRRMAALERELAQRPAVETERVEVPVLSAHDGELLRGFIEHIGAMSVVTQNILGRLSASQAAPRPPAGKLPSTKPAAGKASSSPATANVGAPNGSLGKCERAILTVLAQHPAGCRSGKLTLLAGYRYSGGFKNALGTLRQSGCLVGPNTSLMTITTEGLAVLGDYEPLPAGPRLADYWLSHSTFGTCERKILQALLEHPQGLAAEELCHLTGYQYSGGFKNALGNLRTAGVLVGRNTETMRASEDLF